MYALSAPSSTALYCSLLHYKLYLVCKIRQKLDVEGVNPESLRDDRFKDFWDAEKAAVDQVSAREYGIYSMYYGNSRKCGNMGAW